VAEEVAEALNRWFRWIVGGEAGTPPACFEALGVDTEDYAWRLGEDVDWEFQPHASHVAESVRISLETYDTWAALSGLLRALGAGAVRVQRSEAGE